MPSFCWASCEVCSERERGPSIMKWWEGVRGIASPKFCKRLLSIFSFMNGYKDQITALRQAWHFAQGQEFHAIHSFILSKDFYSPTLPIHIHKWAADKLPRCIIKLPFPATKWTLTCHTWNLTIHGSFIEVVKSMCSTFHLQHRVCPVGTCWADWRFNIFLDIDLPAPAFNGAKSASSRQNTEET